MLLGVFQTDELIPYLIDRNYIFAALNEQPF
jgi:hypothetical protein